MCIVVGEKSVSLRTDSQLVTGQLRGAFEIRETDMQKYVKKAKVVIAQLGHFEI